MRGAYPKDPALRQRRNKAPSRAILQAVPEQRRRAPSLPKIQEWHKMTVQWWREIWRSPMASEYLDADVQALFRLAIVVDAFWTKPKLGTFEAINRAQAMFGLTPLDRRRLEWIVEKAEQATKGRRRTPPPTPIDDPLRALRVV